MDLITRVHELIPVYNESDLIAEITLLRNQFVQFIGRHWFFDNRRDNPSLVVGALTEGNYFIAGPMFTVGTEGMPNLWKFTAIPWPGGIRIHWVCDVHDCEVDKTLPRTALIAEIQKRFQMEPTEEQKRLQQEQLTTVKQQNEARLQQIDATFLPHVRKIVRQLNVAKGLKIGWRGWRWDDDGNQEEADEVFTIGNFRAKPSQREFSAHRLGAVSEAVNIQLSLIDDKGKRHIDVMPPIIVMVAAKDQAYEVSYGVYFWWMGTCWTANIPTEEAFFEVVASALAIVAKGEAL